VSDFVLDASLALQWFLEDEKNRKYGGVAPIQQRLQLPPLRPILSTCNVKDSQTTLSNNLL
jgi:hypothetical protein